MYDRKASAEALAQLHNQLKNKNGKKPTFKELSRDIMAKQGVYISDTSLCDYENTDKDKDMSVRNMVALADYYGVSYDYLLGNSESRERENINVNKKFGLSDEALARIQILNNTPQRSFEISLIETLNAFIESTEFGSFIDTLAKCSHAHELRERGTRYNTTAMNEVLGTLTEEQRKLSREGKLIIVSPEKYFDVLLSMLQKNTVDIAVEMAEQKSPNL